VLRKRRPLVIKNGEVAMAARKEKAPKNRSDKAAKSDKRSVVNEKLQQWAKKNFVVKLQDAAR